MNAQLPADADLEKIEAVYLRLKPLRDLEASVRSWKQYDWRGILGATVVTVCYGFAAAVDGWPSLTVYMGVVVSMLMWLGVFHSRESKRAQLVTDCLRALADELNEVRKKQA